MNAKRIKLVANIVVLFLFVMSIIIILKCSDLPNVFALTFMEKPKSNADIAMSVATSFFVTAVFYFIMNFLPELISEKEKNEEKLPKRKLVHREVQLCIVGLVNLWKGIIEEARKIDGNIPVPESIDKMFQSDCLVASADVTILSAPSDRIDSQMNHIPWQYIIITDLENFCHRATAILQNYHDILPGNITYDLFYLLNESIVCGQLTQMIRISIEHKKTNKFPLSTCIPISYPSGVVELEETRKAVFEICKWANDEYDALQQTLNADNKGGIYKIDMTYGA